MGLYETEREDVRYVCSKIYLHSWKFFLSPFRNHFLQHISQLSYAFENIKNHYS